MNTRTLTSVMLLITAVFASGAGAALVGWWDFEDSSNRYKDASNTGNDAEPWDDAAIVSGAAVGTSCIEFDGAGDYLSLYPAEPNMPEEFKGDFSSGQGTFAFWVKLDNATPTSLSTAGLANCGVWSMPSYYPSTDGMAYFNIFLNHNYTPVPVVLLPGFYRCNWNHIAITADSSNTSQGYKVYQNGYLVGTYAMDGSSGNWVSPMWPRIGACYDVNTNAWSFLDGKIDDVRIYNTALDQATVRGLVGLGTVIGEPWYMVNGNFKNDANGFSYADDVFGTAKGAYASGSNGATYGYTGGGLRVYLGPGPSTGAASGGFNKTFYLNQNGNVRVSLRYRVKMGPDYSTSNYAEARMKIDSTLYGNYANSSLVHMNGNGAGGAVDDTGWQSSEWVINLAKGTHTLTVGGYTSDMTSANEYAEIYFDDVIIQDEWATLAYTDFETGFGAFYDAGGDSMRVKLPSYSHQGKFSGKMRGGSTTSKLEQTQSMDLATPNWSQVKLSFWFKAGSMDASKYFVLNYFNGTTWQEVRRWTYTTNFANDTYYFNEVILDKGTYTFPTNAKFQFRLYGADNGDSIYVDEVRIQGRSAGLPDTQLTWDSFENTFGNFYDAGGDCINTDLAGWAQDGTWVAKMRGQSSSAKVEMTNGLDISTPGYTQLVVDFWFWCSGMEANEYFILEYYNGSAWSTLGTYTIGSTYVNGTAYHKTVYINKANYAFPTGAKIRWRNFGTAGDTSDASHVDAVRISGR